MLVGIPATYQFVQGEVMAFLPPRKLALRLRLRQGSGGRGRRSWDVRTGSGASNALRTRTRKVDLVLLVLLLGVRRDVSEDSRTRQQRASGTYHLEVELEHGPDVGYTISSRPLREEMLSCDGCGRSKLATDDVLKFQRLLEPIEMPDPRRRVRIT